RGTGRPSDGAGATRSRSRRRARSGGIRAGRAAEGVSRQEPSDRRVPVATLDQRTIAVGRALDGRRQVPARLSGDPDARGNVSGSPTRRARRAGAVERVGRGDRIGGGGAVALESG